MPPPEDAVRKFFDDDRLVERMLLVAPFQALPPLILTSRRMNQHAVPLVWRVLPSSIHLLNLIPGLFVWRGKWSLPGVVTRTDVQRFDYYAQFVFEVLSFFSSTCGGPCDINPHTFNVLATVSPNLFPQLRKVVLKSSFRRDMATPTPFFSPHLEEAHLFPRRRLSSHLMDLLDFSPCIHTLTLGGPLSLHSIHYLSKLSSLTKLSLHFNRLPLSDSLPHLLYRFLSSLWTIPSLSSLTLVTPKIEILPLHPLPPNSLSAIRYLELKGHVMTFEVILRVTSNLVEVLLLPLRDACQDWYACLGCLARTSSQTLVSLTLRTGCFLDFSSAFARLANTPNIRVFRALTRSRGSFGLRDIDLLNISNMWAQLEYFITPVGQRLSSGVTLLGISHLSKLQHLRLVELQVSQERFVWPDSHSDGGLVQEHMLQLVSGFCIYA